MTVCSRNLQTIGVTKIQNVIVLVTVFHANYSGDMMKMEGKKRTKNIPIFEPFYLMFFLPRFNVLPEVSGLQSSIYKNVKIMNMKNECFSDIQNHITV